MTESISLVIISRFSTALSRTGFLFPSKVAVPGLKPLVSE